MLCCVNTNGVFMKKTLIGLCLCTSVFAETTIAPESFMMSKAKFYKSELSKKYKTNAKGDVLETMDFGAEPVNWYNLSPSIDGVQGVATESAYLKYGEPTQEIIVAVIDSGVDVNHEDLQGKVWINEDEIPNNNIDDDGNGYIDDVFGWNFIGGAKGMASIKMNSKLANGMELIKGDPAYQVDADTLEVTREVLRLRKLKAELNSIGYYLSTEERNQLAQNESEVARNFSSANARYIQIVQVKNKFDSSVSILEEIGLTEVTMAALDALNIQNTAQENAKKTLVELLDIGYDKEVLEEEYAYTKGRRTLYDLNANTRFIVGDDESNPRERIYGNNDVIGPDSSHGTHVAGTIAANRKNNIGTKGVATNAKIMAIRCVPNGDERDKDVANSIRYAVDNGAQIINMSFGKSYSPNKEIVDEAVAYAHSKGVILVHAAGNEFQNTDLKKKYPNKFFTNGDIAPNWMEVGASAYMANRNLAAGFSNYGKTVVDLFAPGKNVRAPFPDNSYQTISGTSMATPVVSGVLALVLGHKDLTPEVIRDIAMGTTTRYPGLAVFKRGLGNTLFSNLSVSGGIINVYNMLEELKVEPIMVPMRVAGN